MSANNKVLWRINIEVAVDIFYICSKKKIKKIQNLLHNELELSSNIRKIKIMDNISQDDIEDLNIVFRNDILELYGQNIVDIINIMKE